MRGYYFVAFFCLLASCSSNRSDSNEKTVVNQNEVREDDAEVLSEIETASVEEQSVDSPEKKKTPPRKTGELVLPFIQKNVCPFEGCKYREIWKTNTAMKVYKSEDRKEEVFSLKKGESFKALKGNVHILKSGKLIITESFEDFKKGEEIPVLAYKGEGIYDLWYKGKVFDDYYPEMWSMQPPKAILKTKPQTEWWIYIVSERGKFGWIQGDGKIDWD